MTLSIEVGTDQRFWDEYVNKAPSAALYHLYGWRHVIEATFGHPTTYLSAVVDSSYVVGVLPLVQLKSVAFGNFLVSLPFFNYGGIVGESDAIRNALLKAAISVATEKRADFVEIRHDEQWNPGLPHKTSKVAMRLDLPSSSDELWKSFPSKLRNQVQRPRKQGMTALVGRGELLDAFYDVFCLNMRDLGTPVYPKSFFRNILRTFPERTWISTVFLDKTPVASAVLAGFKDRLEIPWASSLRMLNKFSPNMLLYWNCLEFACQRGYAMFDFGRSTPGEGTYRFKEQWGAKPHPLYWYYWLPNGHPIPEINPKNPKYQAAIAIWRRLPMRLTRLLGPRIVKYIP